LKSLRSFCPSPIENSCLYEQLEDYSLLEQKVKARTRITRENEGVGKHLQKLKGTQAQIIAQEKLASLGFLQRVLLMRSKSLNFVTTLPNCPLS